MIRTARKALPGRLPLPGPYIHAGNVFQAPDSDQIAAFHQMEEVNLDTPLEDLTPYDG